MNCHPERSKGPASCREPQVPSVANDADSRQIRHIHRRLFATIAAAALVLAPATQAQSKPAPAAKPATRDQDPQLYRNTAFGFRYQIPYGWVDRTKQMQEGNEAGTGKGEVLLAAFERPPEATGDTINSAVVIASESAASYPGLKRAE